MPNSFIPDEVLKVLFENIVESLNKNDAKDKGKLAKYTLEHYYERGVHNYNLFEKNFIDVYVYNESLLENTKGEEEKEGLKLVYNYIFQNNQNIDIYFLKKIHQVLFSKVPYPEVGGQFRNAPARLEGTNVPLCDYEDISFNIDKLNKDVVKLVNQSHQVYGSTSDKLFDYIEKCIILNTKLIYIHPFFDGNGRSVRAFTNKLFSLAGIPPVYIDASEKQIYHSAMQKAIIDNDYKDIFDFYYAKICQSIYELDLNPSDSLKDKNDYQKIIQIVENYKQDNDLKGGLGDISFHNVSHIKKDLGEENIESFVHTLNDNYSYLMAKLDNEDVLIDPTFSVAIKHHFIDIYQTLTDEEKQFLKNLYLTGVGKPTFRMLEIYFEVLGVLDIANKSVLAKH